VRNQKSIASETSLKVDTVLIGAEQTVSVEQIAKRAYEIYDARGRAEGCDLNDWLQAEHELRQVPIAESRTAAATAGK